MKSIVCNMCGKELDIFDRQENFTIKRERIGYGSVHDGDGLDMRLCCSCLDKLVESCAVDPVIESD